MRAVMAPRQGRRRRADAGVVRPTPRDARCMSWVVEQYGMPLDLLVQVAGTTEGAVRNMIARWRRAGWVESGQLGDWPPVMWVWATDLGCEVFGRRPYTASRPSAARIAHHRAVIETRLYLEQRLGDRLTEWRSERELRWELGALKGSAGQREHLPDGTAEFTSNDPTGLGLFVVEVEISPKSAERLKDIITGLFGRYREPWQHIVYFVTPRTAPLVGRARDELAASNPQAMSRFRVEALPGVDR